MIVAVTVLVVFLAIVALILALGWRQESPMAARIASVRGDQGINTFQMQVAAEPISDRVLGPIGKALARKLSAVLPQTWISYLDRRLVQAGQPVTLGGFLVAVLLVEGTMVGFGFTIVLSSGTVGVKSLGILLGTAGFGLFLPRVWLENKVRHRQSAILKSLPDAFDLITVCVEAGLGLDAALARVAERVEGPFAEELAIALHDVSFGKLRRDALSEMSERCDVPDLSTFINAVVQAETMGTSIATVLRVQAESMRIRRRQRAEQQAYKAPVKMIFPLVFCIFPTIFIVILGPAAIRIVDTLSNKGG